jgi:hypothetical protein
MHFKRLKDIIMYDFCFNPAYAAARRVRRRGDLPCRQTGAKELSKTYFSDHFSIFKNIDHLVRITLVQF